MLEFYAAPQDTRLTAKAGNASSFEMRKAYVTSWMSIVNLLCILPWWAGKAGIHWAKTWEHQARMLRAARLVMLDGHVPIVLLMQRVFLKNAAALRAAAYLAFGLLLFTDCGVWVGETYGNLQFGVEKMRDRYASIGSGLHFIAVHLAGDYPYIDYTFVSKIFLTLSIITAAGTVSIPASIVATGMVEELQWYFGGFWGPATIYHYTTAFERLNPKKISSIILSDHTWNILGVVVTDHGGQNAMCPSC